MKKSFLWFIGVFMMVGLFTGCDGLKQSADSKALEARTNELAVSLMSEKETVIEYAAALKELNEKRKSGEITAAYFAEKAPVIVQEIITTKAKIDKLVAETKAVKDTYESSGGMGWDGIAWAVFGTICTVGSVAFPQYMAAIRGVQGLVHAIGSNDSVTGVKSAVKSARNPVIERQVKKFANKI